MSVPKHWLLKRLIPSETNSPPVMVNFCSGFFYRSSSTICYNNVICFNGRILILSLPEHLSSPPVFSGVHVTRSLVLYVCFVDRCLSFCTFSFGHCVVCSSLMYGFWIPLWYLKTHLTKHSTLRNVMKT